MREFKPTEDSLNRQCGVILSELRKGPRSTLDFRGLGVAHPGGRVLDLRRSGFQIITRRRGAWAEYVLVQPNDAEGAAS